MSLLNQLKLIKKGFESLRLSFNGNQEEIGKLVNMKDYNTIEELEKAIQEKLEEKNHIETDFGTGEIIGGTEMEIQELINEKKKLLGFVEDYYILKNNIFNLVDGKNFISEKYELHDRLIINIAFRNEQEDQKNHRIIQINEYKKLSEFGIGTIKVDGMFWRIKEETIFSDPLYEIEQQLLNSHFEYLQRIDFYLDYEGKIQDFLDQTKIRGFKKGSLFEGGVYKSRKKGLEINETATIYWGTSKTKRILARLYNKRKDCIDKGKKRFYSYVNEETKRFEIEIEEKEIRDWKYLFDEQDKTIRNFCRFLYKNTVLKTININGYNYKKFDIDLLEDERIIYDNIKEAKKTKNNIKNQSSFKLKHYWGYTKTMLEELGEENFYIYLKKFTGKENKNQ